MAFSEYEQIVEEALETLSDGPWTDTDLGRVRNVINDEFCGGYGPDCTYSTVIAWLDSLSQKDQHELIARLNDDWNEQQQRRDE